MKEDYKNMDKQIEESTNKMIEELERFIDLRIEYNLQNILQQRINTAIKCIDIMVNKPTDDYKISDLWVIDKLKFIRGILEGTK